MKHIFNLVILGKSGVGKSSLINYFFDKEVAKSGAGRPVTGQEFEKYTHETENEITNIYDSWGVEAGKTEDWISLFDKFVEERKGTDVGAWIHTAIYCLSAESRRVEEFERSIIKKLEEENLEPIIVINKSDLDDDSFYNEIKKQFPKTRVVKCCNITQSIGIGKNKRETEKFGLKELKNNIADASTTSFVSRFDFVKNNIIKNRRSDAPKILEGKVDNILNNSYKNILGNIGEKELDIIYKKVVEQIEIYNKETDKIISDMFFDATEIYGAFYKDNQLVLEDSINSTIDEDKDDLRSIFMKSLIHSSILKSILLLSKGFFRSLILGPILPFVKGSEKLIGSSKEDIKEELMNKIKAYYKK